MTSSSSWKPSSQVSDGPKSSEQVTASTVFASGKATPGDGSDLSASLEKELIEAGLAVPADGGAVIVPKGVIKPTGTKEPEVPRTTSTGSSPDKINVGGDGVKEGARTTESSVLFAKIDDGLDATNRGARQFSGGAPSLEGSVYNADVVNARSADFYRLYGDNPARGTMSNVEARQWYLAQDAQILNRIDSSASLESQARQAFDLRNANRTQAREFMSDRVTADRLIREEPNMTWNQMLEYQRRNKGLTGDDAYRSILQSSQKTRASVNKQLGVE